MKHTKKIFYFCFLITILTGCASIKEGSIREYVSTHINDVDKKDGISKKEAILTAQNCLLQSEYSNKYYVSEYSVNFDQEYKLWGIGFKAKSNTYDECMYGALIPLEPGEISCQCLNGL